MSSVGGGETMGSLRELANRGPGKAVVVAKVEFLFLLGEGCLGGRSVCRSDADGV